MDTACMRRAAVTHGAAPLWKREYIGPRAHRSRDPLLGKSLWEKPGVEEGGECLSGESESGPGASIGAWGRILLGNQVRSPAVLGDSFRKPGIGGGPWR